MFSWLMPLLLMALGLLPDGDGGAADGTGGTPGAGGTPAQPAGQAGGTPAAGADAKDDKGEDVAGLKAALAAERKAAKEAREAQAALQRQIDDAQAATQSDAEKAVAQARREAKAEADGRWTAHIRAAEVRGALRAAGIVNDKFLNLALAADEFKGLKVDPDTGAVEGVGEAVAKFKEALPEAFGKPAAGQPAGQWDGGQGGNTGSKPAASLEEAVDAHYQGK